MPLVKIEIEQGFDSTYQKESWMGVHDALVECIRIPDHDRRQRLYELDPSHFEHTGRSRHYTNH